MTAPLAVVTVLLSGSTPSARSRIQLTSLGITLASDRRLSPAGAQPPPTRVHSGW